MKQSLILFLCIFFVHTIIGQVPEKLGKVSSKKIVFSTKVLKEDSVLTSWPLLLSVPQEITNVKPGVTESFKNYSVNFYPEKDGIVYLEFQNLASSVKPELYIYNKEKQILYSTKALSNKIAINLREVSSGSYFLSTKIDGEILTWELVK